MAEKNKRVTGLFISKECKKLADKHSRKETRPSRDTSQHRVSMAIPSRNQNFIPPINVWRIQTRCSTIQIDQTSRLDARRQSYTTRKNNRLSEGKRKCNEWLFCREGHPSGRRKKKKNTHKENKSSTRWYQEKRARVSPAARSRWHQTIINQ